MNKEDRDLIQKIHDAMNEKRHIEIWCPCCTKNMKVFSNGGYEPADLEDQKCPSCGLERVKRDCIEEGFRSGWPQEYDNVVDFIWEAQMAFEDEWWDKNGWE
jgi:hypothetical protein